MPRLRLIGLMLFVTTTFVGLVAIATQTKEIRFTLPEGQKPWIGVPEETVESEGADETAEGVKFYRVPIVWPLTISGGAGLLLWFGTAPHVPVKNPRRRRRRRK